MANKTSKVTSSSLHMNFKIKGDIRSLKDIRDIEIEAFQIDEIEGPDGTKTTQKVVPEHIYTSSCSSTSSCCA